VRQVPLQSQAVAVSASSGPPSATLSKRSIGRSGGELVIESRVNVRFSFGDDGEVVETVQV